MLAGAWVLGIQEKGNRPQRPKEPEISSRELHQGCDAEGKPRKGPPVRPEESQSFPKATGHSSDGGVVVGTKELATVGREEAAGLAIGWGE